MATVVDIFEINVQPIAESLSNLGAQIESTKKQFEELKKTQGANSEEAIKASAEVKALTKEYRSIETVLVNNTKALYALDKTAQDSLKTRKFEENSIDTNRKLYNSLYNELVRQKKPTEDQIKLVGQLSEALKKQESALGDNRRNVGNYSAGFVSAFETIKGGIPALGGFEKAQKGVNLALSANPIGGVIALLIGLKDIFGGNAVVADQLTFAVDGLTKGFNFIIDTIVDTVTNFDKLTNAIKHPIDFLGNLASGTLKAGKEGFEASKQLDKLTESLGESAIAIEKNNVVIEQQKTILMNKKRTDQERLEASKKIIALETENTQRLVKNAETELKAEQLKLKGKTKSAEDIQKLGLLEAKIERERSNGIASIRKAENENYKILYGDQEEIAKEAMKKRDELNKQRIAQEKAYQDNLIKLNDEFLLTEREKIEKQFEDKINQITGDSQKEELLRIAIIKKQQEALLKFDEDSAKKAEDYRKKLADERTANQAKEFNQQIALNKQRLDLDIEAVELSVGTEQEKAQRKRDIQLKALEEQLALTRAFVGADGFVTKEELNGIEKIENAIKRVRQTALEKPKEENATFGSALGFDKDSIKEVQDGIGSITNAVNAVSAIINANSQIRLQEIEDNKNAEIDAINQSGASKAEKEKKIREIEQRYAREKYEAEKSAFETNKALQIVNTVIATALGVVSAFQLGPIAGAIAAAAIAITGGAQIAVIASQKPPPPPKFKDGVIGLDGAGNATSDSIDAKLSRGESVMTAKATNVFAKELAQMELAVGNKPNIQLGSRRFASGFIPTNDGGFYNRSASKSMMNSLELISGFENAVAKMPTPVLAYDEFENFTQSRTNSIGISEL